MRDSDPGYSRETLRRRHCSLIAINILLSFKTKGLYVNQAYKNNYQTAISGLNSHVKLATSFKLKTIL